MKKRNKKKSHKMIYGLLVVFLVLVVYTYVILSLPLKNIYATTLKSPITTSGKLTVAWPTSGESSIGVQGYGTVVSNGVQTPTQTASIAKLVTALSVLNKYPLKVGEQGPTITIQAADVTDYNNFVAEDGSVVKVVAGEQITEYQAIQAMMLPSANNMADTLANWAFGSTNSYVVYANQYVKELGMNQTTIADASGFSPNTLSTSNDLIKLGEASLDNPVLSEIVGQKSAVLPVVGLVMNVDWFIGQDDLIGIKTGNTDQAGGCFLSAAKYDLGNNNSITIIGAVMKASTLQSALDQTIPMLQSVKNQIQLKTLPAGTASSTYYVPWEGDVASVTKSTIAIPYIPGLPLTYINNSTSIKPVVNSGRIVGSVVFGVGNDKSSTPLILSKDINQPSLTWKLLHPQYFI